MIITSCGGSDVDSLSNAERTKLLDKYEAEKQARKEMDSLLILISDALDSVNIERNQLSGLINREDGTSRSAVLNQIAVINQYIKQSNERIKELEQMLANEKYQNASELQGLQAVIKQLKDELAIKEKEIAKLRMQVAELTDEVVNLRGQLQFQEGVITETQNQLSETEENLDKTKENLATTEKEKQLQQIKTFIAKGDGSFAEASKVRLAPNKKHELYIEAYNYYKQARDKCGNDAYFATKKQECQQKMNKAKAELPKKKQKNLN